MLSCEDVAVGAKVEQIDREDLEYFLDYHAGDDLQGVNPADGDAPPVAINNKSLSSTAVIIFDKPSFTNSEVCEVFITPLLKPPR